LAERLGDISRQIDADLTERTARLERTEERIRDIIAMQIDGDRSPHVAQMRKDLETQAASESASVDALRARASAPLELPTVQGLADRVQQLNALLDGGPVEPRREALRRYLKGGSILLHPQPDRTYIARAELLPLAAFLEAEAETPPGGRRRYPHLVARGGFEPPTFGL